MPKTEIQTMMIRVSQDYIRDRGFDPRTTTLAEVPVAALEYFWQTTKCVGTFYEARKVRLPHQRVVRKANATYPATVIDKNGQGWFIHSRPLIDDMKVREEARERAYTRSRERVNAPTPAPAMVAQG